MLEKFRCHLEKGELEVNMKEPTAQGNREVVSNYTDVARQSQQCVGPIPLHRSQRPGCHVTFLELLCQIPSYS